MTLHVIEDGTDTERHSWQPASLIRLAANPPAPPTIGGILYPGLRTVLYGESESMKTWLALILAKEEMTAGYPVAWVDLDAMGPGAMLDRLRLLGADDTQIDRDFLYYEPDQMLDTFAVDELQAAIRTLGIRMFVIDSFNPMLGLHGYDMNQTADVDRYWRELADPISEAGAAPVMLDHVVKNTENRGKYAIGSERKLSGAHVALGFRLLEPLTIGGKGQSVISVHKDRPGHLPRPLGKLVLESDGDTITYKIEPDTSHLTGRFRPTIYMERVSVQLELQNEPKSTKWCETNVEGKAEPIRKALKELVNDGYLAVQDGPAGAKLYHSKRPYRQADDTPDTTSSQPRPTSSPDLRSSHLVPSSHPLRGDEDETTSGRDEDDLVPGTQLHEYDHTPDPFDPGPDEPDHQPLELPTDWQPADNGNQP